MFKRLSVISRCLDSMNIYLIFRSLISSDSSKNTKLWFSQKKVWHLLLSAVRCGYYRPKWNCFVGVIFRRIAVCILEAQTEVSTFVEAGSAHHLDFIIVQYSATRMGLLSSSRFCFHGNTFRVNCMWESVCSVFALMFICSTVNNFLDWLHSGAVMHYSRYVEPRDGAMSILLLS
jgi:hypothetical protein